ncbi:MAG TPA: metallophosphatase domain-containing protein [Terracidiphilus sp.]|nr:metallophosphatase domain-containing protein [Terracidiphilus sp.]
MRIVAISDTHGHHDEVSDLPEGDILLHAGDFMNAGYHPAEISSFNRWMGKQHFAHRIVIAGNHDRFFEDSPSLARAFLTNAIYLENSGVTVDGISFWGSPYTPEFMNWAFMYPRGPGAARYWEHIPNDLDVLITHGPPYGILDQVEPGGERLGCEELLKAVLEKKPKVHVFGHIHGGVGTFDNGTTRFINAAYLNERYRPSTPAGKVHVIDLE